MKFSQAQLFPKQSDSEAVVAVSVPYTFERTSTSTMYSCALVSPSTHHGGCSGHGGGHEPSLLQLLQLLGSC